METFPRVPLKERRKRTQRERGWFWRIIARALFTSRWFYRPQFLLRYFILMKLTTHIILQLCLPRMSRKGNKPILLAMQIPEPFWASSQRSRVSSRSLEDFLWYLFYSARVINHVVKTQEIPASSQVARHHFWVDIWGMNCPCRDFAFWAKSGGGTLVARVYKRKYL